MSKVYLSGAMTGFKDLNRELFAKAEQSLKLLGYTDIVNPHNHPKQYSWEEYIVYDLEVVKTCDVVVLLPLWFVSKGVREEIKVALKHDIPILTLEEVEVYSVQSFEEVLYILGLSLETWLTSDLSVLHCAIVQLTKGKI